VKIFGALIDYFVGKLTRNAPRWRFTRFDGVVKDVACLACDVCKNYFWFQHAEIELPKFCPFCGTKHPGVYVLTNEEIAKKQV
jgi:ribosomal protein L33